MCTTDPPRVAAWLLLGLGACVGLPPAPPAGDSGTAGSTSLGSASTTSGVTTAASSEGESNGVTLVLDEGSSSTSGGATGPDGSTSSDTAATTTTGDGTTGEPVGCHPLLAEVLYKPQGADDMGEWVRLYNPCPEAIVLLGAYSLGWAGNDYVHGQMDLVGVIEPSGCWLVGGPFSSSENANPEYHQAMDFDPDMEQGGSTADGVALFFAVAANVTAETLPVDAVIYGTSNDNGLLDPEGNTPVPYVEGDVPGGYSMRRTGLATSWVVEPMPTPNECPMLL